MAAASARSPFAAVRSNYPGIIKVCVVIILHADTSSELNWVTWEGVREGREVMGEFTGTERNHY